MSQSLAARPAWQTPHLVVNPSDDEAFRGAARRSVDGATTIDALQARLRGRYPSVTVHERLLSEEPFLVWYVYREGRWVGPDRAREERRVSDERAG